MTLDELVSRTPVGRDRYMDFLRGLSITMVVFGHWLIATVSWQNGLITAGSILGTTPGIWAGTWIFQVMPIFFFVGGFANLVAYRSFRSRGLGAGDFIRSRAMRLLKPSLLFLGIWLVIQIAMHLGDLGAPAGIRIWGETRMLRGFLPPGQTLPFGPIWFLGVYLVVVAIAPLTIWLHERFGWGIPIALAAGSIATDVIGFGFDAHTARYANVAFVLLFPHQLGHLYADGGFTDRSRRVLVAMATVGLAGLIALTNPWLFEAIAPQARFDWFPTIGHYPKSLLGTGTEPISNAYPPTLPYLFVGLWTIGLALLLKPAVSRWLQRRGPWKVVVAANAIIMSLFLWHMTAYLVSVLVLWPLGWGRDQVATSRWWLEKPVWMALSALFLAGIVALVARYERPVPRVRPAIEPEPVADAPA